MKYLAGGNIIKFTLESHLPRHLGIDIGWGNGYVGVLEDHPWYNVKYDDIDCCVHGGLTFGRIITQDDEVFSIAIGFYVVGFDTAHYGDNLYNCSKEYVEKETENLYQQAIKAVCR